jgi:hypothetical protein
VNTFYESLAAEFETRIADLRPTDAYVATRHLALDLAKEGFSEINAQLSIPATPGGQGKRSTLLLKELERAYGLYACGARHEAFEIVLRVTASAEIALDPLSEIDALHLKGRIHFDENRFIEAGACFAEEMDRSQRFSCVPGFVRAVHEASRVRSELFDLLRAEFGFRFAWDYYTASMMLRGPQGSSDAPGSDQQNAHAAIRSLRALSESYVLFERGPVEAAALIEKLASPHFSSRNESGAAFFEVRGFATACLASIPEHQGVLARMASRAMSFHRRYPRLCSFLLEEAEFVADLCGNSFPRVVRRVLATSAGARPLRSAPFYKASTVVLSSVACDAPFGTPDLAAENASALYRYLTDSDGQGRYV